MLKEARWANSFLSVSSFGGPGGNGPSRVAWSVGRSALWVGEWNAAWPNPQLNGLRALLSLEGHVFSLWLNSKHALSLDPP